MSQKHVQPVESEGQRLLLEIDMSNGEIGALVGVSGESVRRWRRGEKAPYERRTALEKHLGIPTSSWERAPRAPTPAEQLAARLDPAGLPVDADGLTALIGQLERARNEPGLSAVTLAKLGGVEVRARESRAKVRTWDEAAILASPVWTRVEDAILAALDAPADADEATKAIYAAIMRRVADALEELGTAA